MPNDRPPIRSYALVGFFALLGPAAVAGGLAIAPLQALAGLIAAPYRRIWPATKPAQWALILFLSFVAWAVLSTLWSPYPKHDLAWKLPAGVFCGLAFVAAASASAASRRLIRAAGTAGVFVLAGLLAFEAITDMALNRLDQPGVIHWVLQRNPARGGTVLVIMAWGAIAAALGLGLRHNMLVTALLISAGVLSLQFDIDANFVGFAVGLCAFGLAQLWPRATLLALASGLAAWLLLSPLLLGLPATIPAVRDALPMSWAIRTEIWRFACETIAQHPLVGIGLDGSRALDDRMVLRGIEIAKLPLHPHSASLQIWLETGFIGAALAAAALVSAAWAMVCALDRWALAAACGALASFGVIANISYGVWQEWWIATAFAAAALVAAARRQENI